MINTSTLHDSRILHEFQQQHQRKINELKDHIEKLQEEIRLIEEFNNRLDDL